MLVAAAVVLTTTACSDDNNGTAPNTAQVRFVNAQTGGTGSLALNTNGTAGSAVAYQAGGSCQTVTAGNTSLSFAASNGTGATTTIPAQTFSAGGRYTVVATGSAAAPQYLVLNDATTSTAASGRAWLRVVNTVGATPFDVYIGAPGAALGTSVQNSTTFNTSYPYLNVPAGSTQVNVTGAGVQTILGTSSTLSLASGTPQTVFFTPAAGLGTYTSFAVPSC